jgi:hypothetical protein
LTETRTATHFGEDFEQAQLAVRGQFNGLADGINEPAEDNFEGAPTGVPLEEFLQGDVKNEEGYTIGPFGRYLAHVGNGFAVMIEKPDSAKV